MARRIEIELTSPREDGSFTWRAAGARQPKGVIDQKLLSDSAKVGDILRVEAEFDLAGITITAVVPSKERSPVTPRIEVGVSAQHGVGTVTTTLVERGARSKTRRDGPPPPRRSTERRTPGAARPTRARTTAPNVEHPNPERTEPQRTERPRVERQRPDRSAERPRSTGTSTARPKRVRPPRLTPGSAHRDAYFATLPPEHRPIADQLALGGLSAVRSALAVQEQEAKAAGQPFTQGAAIVAIAEQLGTSVREALWLDRAEAAVAQLDTISLRDLRSTVAGAAPHDDAGRALLTTLRSSLEERLAKLREAWEKDISQALEEKRVLHALRLSARPPEPSTRLAASLVGPLVEAASAALNPDVPVDRYITLLEAAEASPVRRSIVPAGLPKEPTSDLIRAASAATARIPSLARLLGLAMPPPPRRLPPRPSPQGQSAKQTRPGPSRTVPVANIAEPDLEAKIPDLDAKTAKTDEPDLAPAAVGSYEPSSAEPETATAVTE